MLGLTPEEVEKGTWARGKGCAECRGTGFKGRIGVFELILGNPAFKAAIARKQDYIQLAEAARQQGYRTMLDDGKAKAMAGWTTPEEVIKAVYTQAVD
jgi:type II secretory ATPase GspE/PulE/Tfp pilus assembly ATPase PilB-like protein